MRLLRGLPSTRPLGPGRAATSELVPTLVVPTSLPVDPFPRETSRPPGLRGMLTIDTCLIVAITILAALNAVLWMYSIPFQRGPDEGAHFQVIRFIRDYGRIPMFTPTELWLINTPKGAIETYATYPPLAYVVAALLIAPFKDEGLWAARFLSVASYVATVGMTYVIARQVAPRSRQIAPVAALVVAFLPQFASRLPTSTTTRSLFSREPFSSTSWFA
jgi:hypothetical protein